MYFFRVWMKNEMNSEDYLVFDQALKTNLFRFHVRYYQENEPI